MTSGRPRVPRPLALLSALSALGPLLVAGCTAPGVAPANPPSAAPKSDARPSAPAVLAEAECSNPKLRVQVTEVARSGPPSVTVKFRFLNPDRSTPVTIGPAFADAGETGSLSGTFVLDAGGRRKLFVLRDDRGQPQCSTDLGQIPAGGSVDAWARYPIPAPGAVRLAVQVPGLPAFRDLPVTEPVGGTGPAGPSY